MNYDAKRYYAFLGVDPACSDDEIRAAFRRRAKQLHPDAQSGNEGEFIRLKKVYDVLGQPGKRANYDRLSRPRSARTMATPRPVGVRPPRPRRFRLGGMSLARFAAACVFMTGLSLAAIEVILADSGTSPSAMFDFSGHRVTSSREAIQRSLTGDPAQMASKSAPSLQAGETAEEFAARMRSTPSPRDALGNAAAP